MSSSCGRSRSFNAGSRYMVTTSASLKSDAKMSPWMNLAFAPARAALRCDRATMSGLNSMPVASAPRLAAAMAIRPSPAPRSTSLSPAFTDAMLSIASTTSSGVGTQMTSLPAWPDFGSKDSFAVDGAPSTAPFCATASVACGRRNEATASASAGRTNFETGFENLSMLLPLCNGFFEFEPTAGVPPCRYRSRRRTAGIGLNHSRAPGHRGTNCSNFRSRKRHGAMAP